MNMERFQVDQSAELDAEVTSELTTNRMGRVGADVLSTPGLLHLMEVTAIKASDPYVPEGHTTVGFAVDGLRHLAPTPIGRRVQVKTVLTEIDRNRLTYSVEAHEGDTTIGVCTHRRAVIPIDPQE